MDDPRPRPDHLALLLAVVCAVALTGCGSDFPSTPSPSPSTSSSPTARWSPSATDEVLTVPVPSATWDDLGDAPDRQKLDVTEPEVPGFTDAPAGRGLQRYLNQQVDWSRCESDEDGSEEGFGYRCARVVVPLDWNDPDGRAITLAMRMRSAKSGNSDEVLFVNPGGPGGSAQDFVDSIDETGLEDYTIVGVDPRGSGDSTPVVCGDLEQTDVLEDADWSPDDQAETDALVAANRDFAAQCREHSGALLDHISSIENAYDMDLVRVLLGQRRLNWYGVSYGTWLGAVYAELYPDHVGRMVLDSAVNVTDRDSVSQVDGFEQALDAFADWCAGSSSCSLGEDREGVLGAVSSFLDGLDGRPLAVDGRMLTQTLAVNGILMFLYQDTSSYPDLAKAIGQARLGDGDYLLEAADAMNGRGDWKYEQMTYSFPAIGCADATDRGVEQAIDDWRDDDDAAAPVLGRAVGIGLSCPTWAAGPAAQIRVTAADAPTILIVSNTGDSATPHEYAQWMREQMPTTVLVSRQAQGHGAFGEGSDCLDGAVTGFLADGTVPQDGLVCTD